MARGSPFVLSGAWGVGTLFSRGFCKPDSLFKGILKFLSGFLLTLDKMQTVSWLNRPDICVRILALALPYVYWSGRLTVSPWIPRLSNEVKIVLTSRD